MSQPTVESDTSAPDNATPWMRILLQKKEEIKAAVNNENFSAVPHLISAAQVHLSNHPKANHRSNLFSSGAAGEPFEELKIGLTDVAKVIETEMASFRAYVIAMRDDPTVGNQPSKMAPKMKGRIEDTKRAINAKIDVTTDDAVAKIENMPVDLQDSAADAFIGCMDLITDALDTLMGVLHEAEGKVTAIASGDVSVLDTGSNTVKTTVNDTLAAINGIFASA
ncbi:hypothetical protein V1509DRAFT_613325 [Lipomyces kononenkoae]